MLAGVSRARITPGVGTPLEGYAGRGPALHVHDDLEATALAFANGDDVGGDHGVVPGDVALVVVACDLVSLGEEEVAGIRRAVEDVVGVPGSRVWVSCSHTHYGPVTDRSGTSLTVEAPVPPSVAAYLDHLRWTVAGAVAEAVAGVRPATVSFGSGSTAIGVNRRERLPDGRIILGQNPDGPFDPRVAVVRVDALDGSPVAAIVNYACHGTSLGSSCRDVSADFIGKARRVVEAETGATCLYVQGAAGNINPVVHYYSWANPTSLGLQLASEALGTYWGTKVPLEREDGGQPVETTSRELSLPGLVASGSLDEARGRVAGLELELERREAEGDRSGAYWAKVRLERTRRDVRVLSGEESAPVVHAEISAARIGGRVGLVSAPGEVFVEIGTSIVKRSPFDLTLYCGYTNGSVHYVPTRAAYAEGGYEVDNACIVAPEAGERLEEESVLLLEQLASAR